MRSSSGHVLVSILGFEDSGLIMKGVDAVGGAPRLSASVDFFLELLRFFCLDSESPVQGVQSRGGSIVGGSFETMFGVRFDRKLYHCVKGLPLARCVFARHSDCRRPLALKQTTKREIKDANAAKRKL